jgi:hypothetical protein
MGRKGSLSVSMNFIQALYDPMIPLPSDVHIYEQMLVDHDFISVAPQVYQLLLTENMLEDTPLFFQNKIKSEFQEAFYINLFIKNQTELLLKGFEEGKIEAIPLKGVFLAEKYFGHTGARSTSDIDLLIKLENFNAAKEIVKSLGFTVEEEQIDEHFHCSFSKVLPGSEIPLTVELHWHLLKENTAHFDIKEVWNDANPLGSYHYIKELSPYHTFYMICLHSWRHNLNSLRYFIDIVQLIYTLKDEIDLNRLRLDSESHQTSKRVIRTLSLVYQAFPNLHQIKKGPQMGSKHFLRRIAFKNRHKKGFWKYIDFIDYQLFSYDSVGHSLMQMKHIFK